MPFFAFISPFSLRQSRHITIEHYADGHYAHYAEPLS
jgi:hypothetical protein